MRISLLSGRAGPRSAQRLRSTKKCTCMPTTRLQRHEPHWVAISSSPTAKDWHQALDRQTPDSVYLGTCRQTGGVTQGSTYLAVQLTGAISVHCRWSGLDIRNRNCWESCAGFALIGFPDPGKQQKTYNTENNADRR